MLLTAAPEQGKPERPPQPRGTETERPRVTGCPGGGPRAERMAGEDGRDPGKVWMSVNTKKKREEKMQILFLLEPF